MTKWLDRGCFPHTPHLALCVGQAEFVAALEDLNAVPHAPAMGSHALATTHYYADQDGQLACLVCVNDSAFSRDPVGVCGSLVHEAVHVWQAYADDIGEERPGREQEAYVVQWLSEVLLAEFRRRLEERRENATAT